MILIRVELIFKFNFFNVLQNVNDSLKGYFNLLPVHPSNDGVSY